MTREFYLSSRGHEKDYSWIQLRDQQQIKANPPIVMEKDQLLIRERPSLLLGRYRIDNAKASRLVLQVTALPTERKDYQQRAIRNSLVCIVDDRPEDEQLLRGIAVKALTERAELAERVGACVSERYRAEDGTLDPQGFSVAVRPLLEYLSTLSGAASEAEGGEVIREGVGKNTAGLRAEVARELREKRLPRRQGSLVVVTELIIEEAFCQEDVHLGLSDYIDRPLSDEEASLRPLSEAAWSAVAQEEQKKKPSSRTLAILILAVLLVLLGCGAFLFASHLWH